MLVYWPHISSQDLWKMAIPDNSSIAVQKREKKADEKANQTTWEVYYNHMNSFHERDLLTKT